MTRLPFEEISQIFEKKKSKIVRSGRINQPWVLDEIKTALFLIILNNLSAHPFLKKREKKFPSHRQTAVKVGKKSKAGSWARWAFTRKENWIRAAGGRFQNLGFVPRRGRKAYARMHSVKANFVGMSLFFSHGREVRRKEKERKTWNCCATPAAGGTYRVNPAAPNIYAQQNPFCKFGGGLLPQPIGNQTPGGNLSLPQRSQCQWRLCAALEFEAKLLSNSSILCTFYSQ